MLLTILGLEGLWTILGLVIDLKLKNYNPACRLIASDMVVAV